MKSAFCHFNHFSDILYASFSPHATSEHATHTSPQTHEALSNTPIKTYSRKRVLDELNVQRKIPRVASFDSSVSSASKLSDRILEMDSPTKAILQNKCKILSVKNEHLKKRLISVKQRANRLRGKKSFTTDSVVNNLLLGKSYFAKIFVNMQLNHKSRRKWNKAEKQLALSLYYKSPSLYKFMLYNLKFSLPSIRTIQTWLKVINLRTGCRNTLFSKLLTKAKTMGKMEKMCVVLFDEIALKRQLEFNQAEDFVEGYHDLATLGRNTKLAKNALVFYIRGLLYSWRIPLCYFVSAGPVNSDLLQTIIIEVIKKLRELTFDPLALVCDQASNNRRALTLLGATKEEPTICVEGHKIFTLFDVPHLLKSQRNNFMNPKLQYIVNQNPVTWSDVTKTFEIDQGSATTRTMLKITSIHIAPTNFQKMRVKYAAQIFSHTVAAAIKTATASGQLVSSTSLCTADFIGRMNDIFDALNSKMLNDPNTKRRPLSIYDPNIELTLRDGIQFFKSIQIFERDRKRENIYCLGGFEWTIKSILLLWNELKSRGMKYLLTGFLNQDPIENFFSVVRNRGGYNPTPTVRQFRIAMQQNINIRLQMAVTSGNCENDDLGDILDTDDIQKTHKNTPDERVSKSSAAGAVFEEKHSDEEEGVEEDITACNTIPQQPSLELCSNVYVAGYLAHSVEKRFNCKVCVQKLMKDDDECLSKNELFLLHKDYSRGQNVQFLKRPSEEFSNIVVHLLQVFNESFMKHKCGMHVSKNVEIDLKNALKKKSDWYSSEISSCGPHHQHIINVFIKMNIFRHLKWESEKYAKGNATGREDGKPHRKIRILS